FQSIDVLDTAKKQATLAQGIAAALNPTALGMVFGMVLLAGYYLVKGMAVNLVERVHYGVAVLTNLLVPQEAMAYMPVAAEATAAPVAMEKSAEEFTPPTAKEETPASSDDSFDD